MSDYAGSLALSGSTGPSRNESDAAAGFAPTGPKSWRADRSAYFFTLPAWILIALTLVVPIAAVIVMSFTDYQLGNTEITWTGLENYRTLVFNSDFLASLGHTCLYALLTVPSAVFIGLMLALLVERVRVGRAAYRAIFFLPVASTLVAMAIVWKYLLHDTIGPVNLLITSLGFDAIPFFSSPDWVMVSLAIIGVWQLSGFNMVLFLAGLSAIPSEIQDAATLDGADGFWRRLFTVTLPLLSPTMLFVVTTSSITAFKLFDTVAVLTRGGPQGASDVLLYSAYREGFENLNTAGAAAMTVIFLVIIVAASWLQAKVSEKRVHYK